MVIKYIYLALCFCMGSACCITYDQYNVKVDDRSKRVSYLHHMKDHLGVNNFEELFKMVCKLKVERDQAHRVLDTFVTKLERMSQPIRTINFLEADEDIADLFDQIVAERELVKDGAEIDFLLDQHEILRSVKEVLEIERSCKIVEEVLKLRMEVLEARLLFDRLVTFAQKGVGKTIT